MSTSTTHDGRLLTLGHDFVQEHPPGRLLASGTVSHDSPFSNPIAGSTLLHHLMSALLKASFFTSVAATEGGKNAPPTSVWSVHLPDSMTKTYEGSQSSTVCSPVALRWNFPGGHQAHAPSLVYLPFSHCTASATCAKISPHQVRVK